MLDAASRPGDAATLSLGPGGALPDAGGAFVLQAGEAEVYVLPGAGLPRLFVGTLPVGVWAFADPRVLVSTPTEALFAARPHADLAALGANPLRRGELLSALNKWTELLAAALARRLGARPDTGTLLPGPVEPINQALAPAQSCLWVQGAALCLFGTPVADTPIAVPPSAWLEAPEGAVARSTADMLSDAGWQAALAAFHGHAATVLAASLRDDAEREAQRLAGREAELDRVLALAADELQAAIAHGPGRHRDAVGDAAWALMQAVPGAIVTPEQEREAADLADLAERSFLHARPVALSGAWWRHDRGPLLTHRVRDGRPVALVPNWLGRYRILCRGEAPLYVSARRAAELDPGALEVLQPLPARPLGITRLVGYGLAICRQDVVVLAGAGFASALIGLALPYATGLMVNVLIPFHLRGPIFRLALALAVITVGNGGLLLCSALARTRMEGRLAGILQAGVLDRALRLPLPVLREMSSSDLSLRVLSIEQLRRVVTSALLEGALGGVFGLASLALLFAYSPAGGFVTLALTVALLGGSWLAGLAQVRALLAGARGTASQAALTFQMIENVVTLRAFGAERRVFAEWLRATADSRLRQLRVRYAAVSYEAGLVAFHGVALALVLGFLAAGGGGVLPVGGYLAFAAAFTGFLATSEAWGRAIAEIVSAKPVFERSEVILRTPPEVQPNARAPGRLEGRVAFSGIAFRYAPDAPLVLQDVSFTVEPGQFAAIVGGSGSGKTTLLSLALGFERPERGAILFDDQDLANLDLAAVRRQIGIVRQNGRLIGGTLLENIRGMHDCTLEEAWQAAERAGIADEIRAMPMGLHTAVIEGSAGFSGGQMQRVLLARALAGQPRILILDEATSALDNMTQATVVRNLAGLGITRLVVAHRLSTIRDADRIFVLHDGSIAEQGGYDELMAADGLFASLARRQTL